MGHRLVAELADFNFDIKYRPGQSNIDEDILSRLSLDPGKYMENCNADMEKDAICATTQEVIHQGQDVTPWVEVISASIDIVHAERAVTDLVFRNLLQKTYKELNRRP